MTTIKNNHDGPLSIRGVTIQPGTSGNIPDWDIAQRNTTVAAWLKAGVIEVEGGKSTKSATLPTGLPGATPATLPTGLPGAPQMPGLPGAPPVEEPNEDDAEKDALIAKLAEHGITRTRKTSLDSLRKQVSELPQG